MIDILPQDLRAKILRQAMENTGEENIRNLKSVSTRQES